MKAISGCYKLAGDGGYGGSTTHYVAGGQYGYFSVGSGWHLVTAITAYSKPAKK